MNVDLRGKHIIVTGGTHGIGSAAANLCVAAGARVSICSRNARDIDKQVGSNSNVLFGLACDVSKAADVEAFFERAEEKFGPLHGVIHAAAIQGPISPIVDVDPEEWLTTLKVDLFGTFLVVREACLKMRGQGGRIAVFSGGGAGTPFPNYTAYACSKVGVVRFVESVAIEMEESGVAINAVAPGFVATRMQQETLAAGKVAAGASYFERAKSALTTGAVPSEIGARCAAWLVSDAATGISGKFVAAPYDEYMAWTEHLEELRNSDLFTLRRILPKERGLAWQ